MSEWLVTGGDGFIGGRIATTTGADSFDIRNGDDILDTEALVLAATGKEGIFHCAAKISVPESFEFPDAYYRMNVEGTASVIRAAARAKTKIVFSSSAAVYGEAGHPVKEEDTLNPQSPYAENKRQAEELIRASGIPAVILRYFNVYGPGQSAAYAGVITAFIRAALRDEDLVIYGDGKQVRDFVYVDDIVAANIVAMESESAIGETFNIGSGTLTSLGDLAQEVLQLTGSASKIRYEASRPGDIHYSQTNIEKAANVLGWKPSVSLKEGLERTIASYKGA